MSQIAEERFKKTLEEIRNTKEKVYSRNLPYLIGMVKALYREFQESLDTGEEYSVVGGSGIIWEINREGIKTDKDKTISIEEYVEQHLKREETIDSKFQMLYGLLGVLMDRERTQRKKLTGKHFTTYTRNEIANVIFKRYGTKIGKTLEQTQALIPELYDDLEKKAGTPLTDEEKGVILLGTLDAAEKLPKILIQALTQKE